jgi:hypothetical protein
MYEHVFGDKKHTYKFLSIRTKSEMFFFCFFISSILFLKIFGSIYLF